MRVPAGRKNLLLSANNCKRMLVACRGRDPLSRYEPQSSGTFSNAP